MPIISPGQSAPLFSLGGIDGRSYTLNQNGARLTLAVFFQTTCPACRLLFPYVEKLHQALHGVGAAVWGISREPRDACTEFASKLGAKFPILIDADGRVTRAYNPEFVPTLLLIDSSGRIMDSGVGFDKAKLNHLSQITAARLGVPPVLIAPPDDGHPAFKQG